MIQVVIPFFNGDSMHWSTDPNGFSSVLYYTDPKEGERYMLLTKDELAWFTVLRIQECLTALSR